MMQFLRDKITAHFDKVLLAVLFLATVILCVHLIHKADAGGDDMTFIVWAETQAAMILGALLGLIKAEVGNSSDQTQRSNNP
jgi:hypothetical protein